MRRQLTLVVAATISAVILSFLIPLALLLANVAEQRAITAAQQEASNLAQTALALNSDDNTTSRRQLQSMINRSSKRWRISILMPNDTIIGQQTNDPYLQDCRAGRQTYSQSAQTATWGPGHYVCQPSTLFDASVQNSQALAVGIFIPQDELRKGVGQATAIITLVALLLLGTAILVAHRLTRGVVRPIYEVSNAAVALSEGDLDRRAPEAGPTETRVLARSLNGLAQRINLLLENERDAIADLSHRLRTPITALRLDIEAIEDEDLAERIRVHVAHLERTVDAVLRDVRRPMRQGAVGMSCDVAEIVRERVAFWSALAYDQGREMHLNMSFGIEPLRGALQSPELTDVLDILLDNVFAHTDEGVPIEVSVSATSDGSPVITIEDGGPGFPSTDVLQRGNSGAGSSGLGLDIARRAALGSGGSLELGRSHLGGALIQITLGKAN